MNINNGVPNGNNMAGVPSWHGMYTGEERQRVVQIIMDTLRSEERRVGKECRL